MFGAFKILIFSLFLTSCLSTPESDTPSKKGLGNADINNPVTNGEYLTTILGCGSCHTEGGMLGQTTGEWLAGSKVGIAYSEGDPDAAPGIVFAGNLTTDKKTGLGTWNKAQIVRMIRSGLKHDGGNSPAVMPWKNYSLLTPSDLSDIADYLKSLQPVRNNTPESIAPGEKSKHAYIRIGVFVFDPDGKITKPFTTTESRY